MDTEGYKKVSAVKGKEMIEKGGVTLVDVREQKEFDEGRIAGSILLPLGEINSRAESTLTDKNSKIMVYCRSGRRSAEAADKLVKLGYKYVYDMGGIIEWNKEGFHITK